MKSVTVGTGIQRLEIQNAATSRCYGRGAAESICGRCRTLSSEKPENVKHTTAGDLAYQQRMARRTALLNELRTQIEAGTYRVDSTVLAEKILKNRTHFT